MNNLNSITDADPEQAAKNLSEAARKLNFECFKDILKCSGVDCV
jgi:hypothetical protein